MRVQISGVDFTLQVEPLAQGLYAMHEEHNALGPLSIGMLDAKIMQVFDKQLAETIAAQVVAKSKMGAHTLIECEEQITDFIEKATKAVTVAIYELAEQNGVLRV